MSKIDKLRREVLESTTLRGHHMGKFTHYSKTTARANCKYCSCYVQINTQPMPNEITISGNAVATNCPIPSH